MYSLGILPRKCMLSVIIIIIGQGNMQWQTVATTVRVALFRQASKALRLETEEKMNIMQLFFNF